MELYRELTHDDPHRKSERRGSASPTKDEGDLFTLRPSPRKLRVLIDDETVADSLPFLDEVLAAFLAYENLEVLRIRMSQVERTHHDEKHDEGYVQVRDVTDHKSAFSYPGPCYSWAIDTERQKFDGSSTLRQHGKISPEPELLHSIGAFENLSTEQKAGLVADDIRRAVLLTEVARAIKYDIVVSEAISTGCREIPANDRSNVVTRADALPIIAHYMRRQQVYVFDPSGSASTNRRAYYVETVAALAPSIWNWLAKCQRSAKLAPASKRFVADCESMIDRLARALRSRDELIASVGALQTADAVDDGADALDHVLVSLCGAVDVLARSLHTALQLPGVERNAKLHLPDGYRKLLALYAEADGKEQLDSVQKHLAVVFNLRNSIHSRTLEAIASLTVDESGTPSTRAGRLCLRVPTETIDSVRKDPGGGLNYWSARELGRTGIVVADLGELLDACFRSVLRFIDQVCRILATECPVDKDPALRESIISAESMLSEYRRELRVLIGMPELGDLD